MRALLDELGLLTEEARRAIDGGPVSAKGYDHNVAAAFTAAEIAADVQR